ncbi:MAG: T9SS type A sorting domain-containing protein [Fidelibacterota bacterium]
MVGKKLFFSLITGLIFMNALFATKLVEMKVVDKNYLMLHFQDGVVKFVDNGQGSDAYHGHHSEPDNSYAVSFGEALNLTGVASVSSWTIKSGDNMDFGATGVQPVAVFRKTRVNGMSYTGWDQVNSDHGFDYTKEHFIYLQLPASMKQDNNYTVEINENLNADTTSQSLTFDIFSSNSEAIHTNLVGYMSSSRAKSADLYHFLGDGGYRDYAGFEDNEVYIYNVDSDDFQNVGTVKFWMEGKTESNHNLTGGDVWNIDFTGFTTPGTYRLAVEGIGCSQEFEIRDDIYHEPYKLSVLGYFYMRIGQDNLDMTPVPRRPLYIQDQDPSNCKIYVTDMDPYHPQWSSFAPGDKWDSPANWATYKKEGSPTNPKAIGGHSDALDWDRHLGHVVNIYDLCLAYILSDGALDDDDLRIAESGNGIPDILDEARNEVDFWLNLRYQGGYSHGITNPDGNNKLYQADNTPIAAWANSLNSAMLAYCFQISGHSDLRNAYRDSAIIAYNYANSLADPMADTKLEGIRGRDFKMMTAAYLYNLTGNTEYEDVIKNECMVTSSTSSIRQLGSYDQIWGAAAYMLTKRAVNYPDLQANMKAAIIAKAKSKEADNVVKRPSRRGYSAKNAWWQSAQDMPRTVIAHAVSQDPVEKLYFLDALVMESDWGLGRNPLNMIQMTTATTELADKRSIENCYTSGRNDGTPGLHPGHTPYLNVDGWGGSMAGSNPGKVLNKFYPNTSSWPHASKYINTRFIWAHSEFTPRQTMKGKALNYAYLYSLSKSGGNITPVLIADAGPDQRIVDEDENGKETVQLDGSGSYSTSSEIISYQWTLEGSEIATGETATVELDTGSYQIILEIEDAGGESAVDSVTIEIIKVFSEVQADYDFETPDQLDDWIIDNWGEGGMPSGTISSKKAKSGSASLKLSGNFVNNADIVLKKNGALADDIETIIYYVWVPQALVDSSQAAAAIDSSAAGGVQNYLMHTGWDWKSKWISLFDLQGDAWNKISFQIPEDVENANIKESGLVFNLQNAGVGESSVYIDDIYFEKEEGPTAIDDNFLTETPSDFKLFHNYPNPFNPETKIRFNLPKSGKVRLTVYNIAGHKVKSLLNENKNAGSYEIIFDGSQLASGVYLYTLEAGDFTGMKKMMLLK